MVSLPDSWKTRRRAHAPLGGDLDQDKAAAVVLVGAGLLVVCKAGRARALSCTRAGL